MTDVEAVIGPPWRAVREPSARTLAADPPTSVSCEGWVAVSVSLGTVQRCGSRGEAMARATKLAAMGDGRAHLFKGSMRLSSGAWLFVRPEEVVETRKAMNPLRRREFSRIIENLRQRLVDAAAGQEDKVLEEAGRNLNVDFSRMSRAEINALVDGVGQQIQAIGTSPTFTATVTSMLESEAVTVGRRSRLVVDGAEPRFNVQDTRAVRRVGSDAASFVTDNYGKRKERWSTLSRRIIERDLGKGLGEDEIAGNLQRALRGRLQGRSQNYYRVVANAAVGRARSFGQLTSMRDAGIQAYEWSAAMDERTCPICAFLNGKVFPVNDALTRFQRAEQAPTPEAAVNEHPWYRVVGDDIFVAPRGQGPTEHVATVQERPNLPSSGGKFLTQRDVLAAGGTTNPPAHGLCRCTLIPTFL